MGTTGARPFSRAPSLILTFEGALTSYVASTSCTLGADLGARDRCSIRLLKPGGFSNDGATPKRPGRCVNTPGPGTGGLAPMHPDSPTSAVAGAPTSPTRDRRRLVKTG